LKRSGKDESKLMSSVDDGQAEENNGKVAEEAINNSIGSFTPDIMFQNLVKNYKNAKKLYGETIIREITDFEPGFVEKNVKIPEFQKELKKNIAANVKKLKSEGILNNQYVLTEHGVDLAAIQICASELDKLKIRGFGDKKTKEKDVYGEKDAYVNYKKGAKYKDVSINQTIKSSIRRKHSNIDVEDIKIFERKKTGKVDIVYALDASGSMKGERLGTSKRAGVALAYKAIRDGNRVGIIVFDSEIRKVIELTQDFNLILRELVNIRASNKTNINDVMKTATDLLNKSKNTKHIVIITDAMPNVGEKPKKDVLESTAIAQAKGITTSVVGVNLEEQGADIAQEIADLGNGRLYKIKKMAELDTIILEDYEFVRHG
jgi:Mg-chelatase subunit ChlD